MKKWFYAITFSVTGFLGCKKNEGCKSTAPITIASASESAYLQNYLTANSITASQKNGMYYVISNQGTGTSPNLCSSITTDYVGNLMNATSDGAQFDFSKPNQPLITTLNNLIAGWQIIFPLIKAGGTATLYIPPSLGYGASPSGGTLPNGQPAIPANSYLKFVVTLKAVN